MLSSNFGTLLRKEKSGGQAMLEATDWRACHIQANSKQVWLLDWGGVRAPPATPFLQRRFSLLCTKVTQNKYMQVENSVLELYSAAVPRDIGEMVFITIF